MIRKFAFAVALAMAAVTGSLVSGGANASNLLPANQFQSVRPATETPPLVLEAHARKRVCKIKYVTKCHTERTCTKYYHGKCQRYRYYKTCHKVPKKHCYWVHTPHYY